MTHQNLRLRKCWKLFWATLRVFLYVAKVIQNTVTDWFFNVMFYSSVD